MWGSSLEICPYPGITGFVWFPMPQVPDELLVERIVGRRSDPETGAIYHLTFRPPPEEVVHRLVQRSDDTEEKVITYRTKNTSDHL